MRALTAYRFFLCVLFLLCALGAEQFCASKTAGFAVYKILSSLKNNPDWEVPPLSCGEKNQISALLRQPYHYLDKGAQSYVFISRDGNTVIKFFRHHRLRPPLWLQVVHLPYFAERYRIKKILEAREALSRHFNSYALAYKEMKEETGLLFLHLNKTSNLKQKLTIIDKIGIAHQLDLDQMEFLVQKRVVLLYPGIEKIVKEAGIQSAKETISNLVSLLALRCKKGISDKDPDLRTNFGLIGTTPVQIDVGRFKEDHRERDPLATRDELLRITDKFTQWLDVHYPFLSDHLKHEIAAL